MSESPIASTKISIPSATPLRMLEKFWSKKFPPSRHATGENIVRRTRRGRSTRFATILTTTRRGGTVAAANTRRNQGGLGERREHDAVLRPPEAPQARGS